MSATSRQAVVRYTFAPTGPDQIAVSEGAVVYVESCENTDWWYVRRASDDATGYVPATYIQMSAAQMSASAPGPEHGFAPEPTGPELEPQEEETDAAETADAVVESSPKAVERAKSEVKTTVRFGRRRGDKSAAAPLVSQADVELPSLMSSTGRTGRGTAGVAESANQSAMQMKLGGYAHAHAVLRQPRKARVNTTDDGDEHASEEELVAAQQRALGLEKPEKLDPEQAENQAMLTGAQALHRAVIQNDTDKVKQLLRPEQRAADLLAATQLSLNKLLQTIPKLESRHQNIEKVRLPAARNKRKETAAILEKVHGKEKLLAKQLAAQSDIVESMVKAASPELRVQADLAGRQRLVHDLEIRSDELQKDLAAATLQHNQAAEEAETAEHNWLMSIKKLKDVRESAVAARTTIERCASQPRLLNWADPLGRTAAWIAADNGSVDVLKVLLEASADVEVSGHGQRSCLQRACFHGHLQVVEMLLNREIRRLVDAADEQGATAFFASCHEGHLETAKLLANKGASIDVCASDGSSPLFVASQNGHFPVVQFLVEQGADKDRARDGGFTPLYIACQHGHLDVVQFLLTGYLHDSDGNCSQQRSRGRNIAEHESMMRVAANFKSADASLASTDGVSPACVAAHEGHYDVLAFLGQHDKKLLSLPTRSGLTPLHCACMEGHVDAARVLADFGVNLSQLDKNGLTPLRMAEKAGKPQAANFVYTKLHPDTNDRYIADQWKVQNDRNVMACHRKAMQEKHIREVQARHKGHGIGGQSGGGHLPGTQVTRQKKGANARQDSAQGTFEGTVASTGTSGSNPRDNALPRRRNAVTILEYSEHLVGAHNFDPTAAAAAATAAAKATAQPQPTRTPSFSLQVPKTRVRTHVDAPMIRMAARRRGVAQTDAASEMFRAASLHERKRVAQIERAQVAEDRSKVFARLSGDQGSSTRVTRRRSRIDSSKEHATGRTASLEPLKMN